jgi:hypothetical protein
MFIIRFSTIIFSTIILAACPNDGNDESSSDTTNGATDESSSYSSTIIMGSTSTPVTATEAGSTSAGDTPTTGAAERYEGDGKCAGLGPATCLQHDVDLCSDLVFWCHESPVTGNPEGFCEALGKQCLDERFTPCMVCKNLWQECTRIVGDVTDKSCEDIGEQCACLAESHGAI